MSGFRAIAITGASRGLGAALARRFAAPGVRLLLIARSEAALRKVAADCESRGAVARIAALDVSDAAALAAALVAFEAEGPVEFQGGVVGILLQRRGIIIGTTDADGFCRIEAEVPLAEMFGFSTVLRSATQGKAEFTMEFSRYAPVPSSIATELIKKHREALEKAKK